MPRNRLNVFEREARAEISDNLKHYMRGMTQVDLAKKSGIALTTLSGYLLGKSTPNAGKLEQLADALHVKKSDIDPRYGMTLDEVIKRQKVGQKEVEEKISLIPFIKSDGLIMPVSDKANILKQMPVFNLDVPSTEAFAFKFQDTSMVPTLPYKAIVVAHREKRIADGHLVAAYINKSITVRRIEWANKSTALLRADSPIFKTVILKRRQTDNILGRVMSAKISFPK